MSAFRIDVYPEKAVEELLVQQADALDGFLATLPPHPNRTVVDLILGVGENAIDAVAALTWSRGMLEALVSSLGPNADDALGHLVGAQGAQWCLSLRLCEDAVHRVSGARKKVSLLLALLTQHKLSAKGRSYVDRAIRLFIWGFDDECAIMCRAVLEEVLKQRISSRSLQTAGYTKPHGLSHYLSYLKKPKAPSVLPPDLLAFAGDVKFHGDNAAHQGLGLHPPDMLDHLNKLVRIIAHVLPPDGAG